jgi:hypothetical protein
MNSRKWQVGMTALVVLSLGLAAFAPFVWRFLRLKERSAAGMAAVVMLLESLWFLLSSVQDTGALTDSNPAGLFGLLAILVAVFGAVWQFRPLNKVEQSENWRV